MKPVNINRLVRTAAAVLAASMLVSAGGTPSVVRRGASAAVATRAGAIADELPPRFSAAQKTAALISVGAAVAGTVLKIDVAQRGRVTAGAAVAELNPTHYRAALSQARKRLSSLQLQIRTAQAALAAGQRQAASGVTVAVGSANTMPPAPAPAPVIVPQIDAATKAHLAEAQRQIAAARFEMLTDAQSEAASARQVLDRDQTLAAQGLIAAHQLDSDRAAYIAAQTQLAAARSEARRAQSGTPPAPEGLAQAQAAVATAQHNMAAAQLDATDAMGVFDRDAALLAQGAVAARQVAGDRVTKDAADARAHVAAAELERAQAQLVAARAEAAAADAMRRQAEVVRRAQIVRAQHAGQTRALAQKAASTIADAARRAQALAGLETEAVTAEAAVHRAEADLAQTVIHAPANGWVDKTVAVPGQNVRSGEAVAVIVLDPNTSTQTPAASPDAPPVPDRAQLAEIASSEGGVLAELNAEAARISTIAAAGIPEVPPAPGTALSPALYGADQQGGRIPTLLNGHMPWPVVGAVTSGYGWRIHPIFDTPEFHTGIDIAASMGTPVEASAAGTVIFAGTLTANGTLVILDHGSGITTTYSHLSAYRVYVGEHVQRGHVIALVGSTGWSTGPHLFFEIRKDGRPIDPLGTSSNTGRRRGEVHRPRVVP